MHPDSPPEDPTEEAPTNPCIGKCKCLSISILRKPTDAELQTAFNELKGDPELHDIFDEHYTYAFSMQSIAEDRNEHDSVIFHKFARARDRVTATIIACRIASLKNEVEEVTEKNRRQHQTAIETRIREQCLRELQNKGIPADDDKIPTVDEIHEHIDILRENARLFSIFNLRYGSLLSTEEIAAKLGVDDAIFIFHYGNAMHRIIAHMVEQRSRSKLRDLSGPGTRS